MQKGFAPILIILGILVALVAISGAYYFFKIKTPSQKACTLEAKICPDGSSVGRVGPNCEFTPCPKSSPSPTPGEIANWKTHVSKIYGYIVQYPVEMELVDCEGEGSCNFTFRLKNKDLLITFGTFGLPKDRSVVDYAALGFCHVNKNDVKQENINSILFYQTKEIFSESNVCLNAITVLKTQHDENSYWIVDIQAKAYSQRGVNLFQRILSTFKFLK